MADRFAGFRARSSKVAFCGLMAALSVTLMLLGGLIPLATYISPLISGALLIPVMKEYGRRSALLCWLTVTILILLFGPDREAACMYLFVGYYPLLKPVFYKIQQKPLRILAKLVYFAAAVALMYTVLCWVFVEEAVLASFRESAPALNYVFFGMMVLCLLLYDAALGFFALWYTRRLRPRLKFFRS